MKPAILKITFLLLTILLFSCGSGQKKKKSTDLTSEGQKEWVMISRTVNGETQIMEAEARITFRDDGLVKLGTFEGYWELRNDNKTIRISVLGQERDWEVVTFTDTELTYKTQSEEGEVVITLQSL